jgi:hypothetical protein
VDTLRITPVPIRLDADLVSPVVATAFDDTLGRRVVVLLNRSALSRSVILKDVALNTSLSYTIEANSIQTFVYNSQ